MYLGLKGLKSKGLAKEEIHSEPRLPELKPAKAFRQGLLCNLLNPKLAVFLLSLFTQFIRVDANLQDKSLVAGIFVCEAAFYWPLLVFLLQSKHIKSLFSLF